MKIINRQQFLQLPAGVLFTKFEPSCFDELRIKGDTIGADFHAVTIADAIDADGTSDLLDKIHRAEGGESLHMDFETVQRDGLFDEDQLFAVWEREDVEKLVGRLLDSLAKTYS